MSRRAALSLLVLLSLAAGIRVRWFTGLQVGDDIVYSKIAEERVHGKTDIGNTQQTRSAFLLPIVVSYALFGVGEGPLLLYNLLCSIALVAAVFAFAGRLWGERAGLIAGAVVAFHPNLVRFATECHTDTPLVLWMTLAVFLLHLAQDGDPGARRRILAGLLLGWCWLHKESTVYLGLFFAGHWLATRRSWTWYLPVALPFFATFAAELAGFALHTGNPLERFAQLRRWHSGTYMAEKYTSPGSILYRDFLELPLRLFGPWVGRETTGLVNLAGLFSGLWLLKRRAPGMPLVAGWFLAIYAGYSFWPSSLRPFLPGFFLFDWTMPVFAAPFAIAIGGAFSRLPLTLAAFATVALAGANLTTIDAAWRSDRRLTAGGREAHAWVSSQPLAKIVTDDKSIEMLDFFDGQRPSRLYLSFRDTTDFSGTAVIVDKFWTEPGQWWSQPLPAAVAHPPAAWRKVYESPRIIVYRP